MELGAPFLESCDVVEQIVKIAENHEVMSLRGTAFFVLGLISRSIHGLEILSENGWDANTNILGHSLGLCIPSNLSQLFSLQPWKHTPVTAISLPDSQKTETTKLPAVPSRPRSESLLQALQEAEQDPASAAAADLNGGFALAPRVELDPDPTNQRILELVIDMSNMVLYRRARSELMQIKMAKRAAGFAQPLLFRKVMSLLECHHYRLADRNMIVGLFEKGVLRAVVFGVGVGEGVGGVGSGSGEGSDDDDEEKEEEDEDEESDGGSGGESDGEGLEGRQEDGGERRVVAGGTAKAGEESESESGSDEEEEEGGDDDNDDEEVGNGYGGGDGESSGDEERTERQRSVSDPADIKRRGIVRGFGR
jgi:hypothetical protein